MLNHLLAQRERELESIQSQLLTSLSYVPQGKKRGCRSYHQTLCGATGPSGERQESRGLGDSLPLLDQDPWEWRVGYFKSGEP